MDKLFRFKLAHLDGIDEPTVIDYLSSQFQLKEEQIKRFLEGKFVFKPCREATVEKSIKLLESHGIKCTKHAYVSVEKNTSASETKIRELQAALDKANKRIAELESLLQANEIDETYTKDDVRAFEEALANGSESPNDKNTHEIAFQSAVDNFVLDDNDTAGVKGKSRLSNLIRPKFLLFAGSAAAIATASVFAFVLTDPSPNIVMDYNGFAQRNNMSEEKARALAKQLGSITLMTEYEIDAKRRNMDLNTYLEWRPYADQCKANKIHCKNAADFVSVHLDGTFIMNQYKGNCEEYVRMKQKNEVQYSPNAFGYYDKKSTAFKDSGTLTLTAEVQIKDDAGMWRDHSIYCQVDTGTARIHNINIM